VYEKDPSDPANASTQYHDYNPGIPETPGGLFWTTFIDPDHVDWDDDLESAKWKENNFSLFDFHDFGNAFNDGPHPPARVTMSMKWFDAGSRRRVRNTDDQFDLLWRPTSVSIAWSGRTQGGGGFTSDAASTSTTLFGMLGRERNGIFFKGDDDDDDD